MSKKSEGTVKFYNKEKGFGFIINHTEKGEVFFHANNVIGDLPKEKDSVQFDLQDGKKGPAAVNVEVLG